MATINWSAPKQDHELIGKIVKRAAKELKGIVVMDLNMDITATHCNGNALDLEKLLSFGEFEFSHDIYGIMDSIDRQTGRLLPGFLPRSTKRDPIYKLNKQQKGKKFEYTVTDENGNVISKRTSTRDYVACTANGEYYFGRLDLIFKGDHGANLSLANLILSNPQERYNQMVKWYVPAYRAEFKANNPYDAWLADATKRALKTKEELNKIAYL